MVSGATLNYDAALDTDGNGFWEDSSGVAGFDWALDGSVSRNTGIATAFPGISAAYVFDGTNSGLISDNFATLPGDPTDGPATFEIWFRPADANVNTGFLFETGSSSNGTNLRLFENAGNTFVEFYVDVGPNVHVLAADILAEMASGELIAFCGCR